MVPLGRRSGMRRAWAILGTALVLVGRTTDNEQRLRDYSGDGVCLFRQGQFLSARESFQAALVLKPDDANLLYNIGQCYDRVGNSIRAQQYYEQCLQRVPNHVECRHALTVTMWNNGQQAEATRKAEDWLAREPKLAAAHAEHAYVLRR